MSITLVDVCVSDVAFNGNIMYAKGGPRFTIAHALHSILAPPKKMEPNIVDPPKNLTAQHFCTNTHSRPCS